MALPPKVQRSGPRRGTPEWGRWLRAGAFVHNFAPWNRFVTLTSRFRDVSEPRARGLLRRWLDALAAEADAHLKVAFAIEGPRACLRGLRPAWDVAVDARGVVARAL
jgi:hypothetical protein